MAHSEAQALKILAINILTQKYPNITGQAKATTLSGIELRVRDAFRNGRLYYTSEEPRKAPVKQYPPNKPSKAPQPSLPGLEPPRLGGF